MTDRPFDVVVVGNVGIDTNVYFYGRDPDFGVESNFTENVDYVGQAGGYASRGFAQLGKRTTFIGYVGDDHSGRFIRQEFARDGVDTTALFIDPTGTSRSVNFMYRDGRRKNFYDGKDHMHLRPDVAVCRSVLARAKLAHFNIPNWARYLLPVARELGLTISCDLQDVISPDDDYRRDFVRYADVLFFSAVNYEDPTPLIESYLNRMGGGGVRPGHPGRRPLFRRRRHGRAGGRYERRGGRPGRRLSVELCAGRLFPGRLDPARADRGALHLHPEGFFVEPHYPCSVGALLHRSAWITGLSGRRTIVIWLLCSVVI
jgi:sugar/nucleoside kinase (ribokinase family)